MKRLTLLLAATLALTLISKADTKDYTKYVDPLIGTDNHGHVAVGANVPFGMVMMGPVEMGTGWDYCSGYNYPDNQILGFSPLHISGSGCADLGDILVMPVSGNVSKSRGDASKPGSGHFSTFSHQKETAQPGYYSVMLDRWDIKAEMTATPRVAWQRYTWTDAERDQRILFDLRNAISDMATDCEIYQIDDHTIAGHRTSTGWSPRYSVYFVAEFSRPISRWRVYEDNRLQPGTRLNSTRAYGEATIAPDGNNELTVRLALSPISVEGAMANLKAEKQGLTSFDDTKTLAQKKWNEALGLLDADFMSDTDRTVFYTALYHMMFAPITYSDLDGSYMGSDYLPHKSPGHTAYTIWSCWDSYRSFHPLATLFLPQMQEDWARSILNIAREQGFMPIWHLMNTETGTMVGISSVPILADMCLKGYVPQELMEEAFQAMKSTMMMDFRGLNFMKKLGYVPNSQSESVSITMEYCLNDWSVAQVAKQLGHTEDYNYFMQRSQGYRKLYDKETGFMRSLNEKGEFLPVSEFKPNIQTRDYTEGNPWQYLWLVPHDVEGLKSLLGGDKIFVDRLDSLFAADSDLGNDYTPDIAGLVGQYAHGNEPSHHIAYLYNYAGRQDKTANIVRKIITSQYNTTKDGLAGNEDVGQMSAWYILSAMGLYQVEPCGGRYQFGSPLVNRIAFKTASGNTFTIVAHNNSAENIHILKAKLNGKPYKKTYIDYSDILNGGTLEFFMGK